MGWTVKAEGLEEACDGGELQIAMAMTATMIEIGKGLKEDLRAQVRGAGLGERMAKTWQSRIYPQGSRPSVDPAGWVWSNAPKVVDAFDRGVSIYPQNGRRYLAIPTQRVPRKAGFGRGRRGVMTPLDVEVSFNQDLIVLPDKRKPGRLLAFVDATLGRRGKARPATKRRLAQGRDRQLILMFVLVRMTRLPKLLDIDAVVNTALGRFDAALARNWR